MSWNPDTYLRFADHRTRPAAELLARVPSAAPARVIDLGCGPGNSTALLAGRWPAAALEGLDNSEAMLRDAAASGIKATWINASIADWSPAEPYDVIFANAALQWVYGHEALLPRLQAFLKPGGVLAFQIPVSFDSPSHIAMRDIAADPRWNAKTTNLRPLEALAPQRYYEIMKPQAARLDIWETEYLQVLEGEDAVYTWVSGTGLRPYLAALNDDERAIFIPAYKAALNQLYPRRADGTTLFPFRRLFAVAVKDIL